MEEGIHHGDCRELMKKLDDESVDAIVTDPPYEFGFMGKRWDATGIAYQVDLWREALRVLKPGGHLLSAGGSRTHNRLACAIEDAGFELRDTICHVFGTGFPKSLDVSKAIDAEAGAEREVVGKSSRHVSGKPEQKTSGLCGSSTFSESVGMGSQITAPATEAAKRWHGYGTALKPAAEYWTVARKPLQGTVAQNVQRFGTGGLDVDGCRVVAGTRPERESNRGEGKRWFVGDGCGSKATGETDQGRWPPNLVLSHSASCGDECAPDCPIREMDRQSGERPSGSRQEGVRSGMGFHGAAGDGGPAIEANSGGASRFFPCFRYEPKASRAERDEGLALLALRHPTVATGRKPGSAGQNNPRAGITGENALRNTHPTVKPIALMRWFVRLVTPPGGLVLDPFTGSGSTGCAAVAEGMRFVGFESDEQYVELAKARLDYWKKLGYQEELFTGPQ